MKVCVGGYNYEWYEIESDFKYAKEFSKGIETGISFCKNNKVLIHTDLNEFSLKTLEEAIQDYSEEKLLNYTKSMFKNSDDITLDMLNLEVVHRDYSANFTKNKIESMQKKLDEFIMELL